MKKLEKKDVVRASYRAARLGPSSAPYSAKLAALRAYVRDAIPSAHLVPCGCGEKFDDRGSVCRFCMEALDAPLDLAARLVTSASGRPMACVANVITVLAHDPRWAGVIATDELRDERVFRGVPPWHGDEAPSAKDRPWGDVDATRLASWMAREHALVVSGPVAADAARVAAERCTFHPVREYLRSVEWDGVARIDTWLVRLCGAEDTPLTRAIAAKVLIGAVARVEEPGCKVDHVLVLEGKQGAGKSRAVRALSPKMEWVGEVAADVQGKDALIGHRGKWILEMSELDALDKNEAARVKAYVTSQVDEYRAPYGRATESHPRQCVFIGTTNENEYLKDATGGRRWWSVRVGTIDVEALAAERDQLWAEALARYQAGEAWHLEDAGLTADAESEQRARGVTDPWESAIAKWLAGDPFKPRERDERRRRGVTTADVLDELGIPARDRNRTHEMRAGQVLRRLGWNPGKQQRRCGSVVRPYLPAADATVDVTAGVTRRTDGNSRPIRSLSQPSQLKEEDQIVGGGSLPRGPRSPRDGRDGSDVVTGEVIPIRRGPKRRGEVR